MPSELQTALTLCLSPGQQPTDYQGVAWEFYPPPPGDESGGTVKLIGTDGRRLTIVTLRIAHWREQHTRFRMTVDDCRKVLAMTGDQQDVSVLCEELLMVTSGDRTTLVVIHDPREYPPAAGTLQHRHATDSPNSSYDLMDLTTAVSESHMVSNGTVHMDLLTYRGLLIEPVLREDLRVICRVQMALHGRAVV